MPRRRKYKPPSRIDNALDLLVSGAGKLIRFTFFGAERSGGGGHGAPRQSEFRWITHEIWEGGFYVDLFFVILGFPFFIGDILSKKFLRARRLREHRHKKRIDRYRASAGSGHRRRRRQE